MEHIFLSPDTETWYPYSGSYSINEDQLVDDCGEMVYPTPRARTVFEPMEAEELSAILDNNTPPVVGELSAIPDNKAPPNFVPYHIDCFEPLKIGELHVNPDDETIIHDNKEHGMFSMVKDEIVTAYDKAYYKVVDAVISSSAVVLDFPPPVEDTVVPDAI